MIQKPPINEISLLVERGQLCPREPWRRNSRTWLSAFLVGFVALCLSAPPSAIAANDTNTVYLFSTFKEPEQDGLRFAYSFDGYHWTNAPGLFLKARIGGGIMRDPSTVQGPDGTYHLVWTSAWRGNKGFGYAHSKDLVHWSEQQLIPVMKQEPTTVNVRDTNNAALYGPADNKRTAEAQAEPPDKALLDQLKRERILQAEQPAGLARIDYSKGYEIH